MGKKGVKVDFFDVMNDIMRFGEADRIADQLAAKDPNFKKSEFHMYSDEDREVFRQMEIEEEKRKQQNKTKTKK